MSELYEWSLIIGCYTSVVAAAANVVERQLSQNNGFQCASANKEQSLNSRFVHKLLEGICSKITSKGLEMTVVWIYLKSAFFCKNQER